MLAGTEGSSLKLWALAAAAALVLVILIARMLLRRARARRRAELFAASFSEERVAILQRNVPLYARLPEELRKELGGHINVFLDEKRFTGCGGLEITDEIRVTIAAQACILLLGRKAGYYPRFSSIFVYPGAYIAEGTKRAGDVAVVETQARAGESWQGGPLVLSWDDVQGGSRDVRDGHNVVLHEFAHKLDQEDGRADGAPLLGQRSRYVTWARVLAGEYNELVDKVGRGQRTVLDDYGATDPAEFFAVLTETFFEKPRQLKKKHPELYEEVKGFYKVDPLEWREPERPDQ